MPPDYPMLTDDYVAELVANEAEDASLKYSSMGLDAFKSNKRPANQPKPNTRFLNNIIRDTNTHNKAILARENAESRARLRELDRGGRRRRDSDGPEPTGTNSHLQDTRKRILGDISAILGRSSRPPKPRKPDPSDSKSDPAREEKSLHQHRHRHKQKHRSRSPLPERKSSSRRRYLHEEDDTLGSSMSRRDRSPLHGESKHESSKTRSSHRPGRHRSPHRGSRHRHGRSSSPKDRDAGKRRRHTRSSPDNVPTDRGLRPVVRRRASRADKLPPESVDDMEESDPLEDLVGPRPAPTIHRRGRGANVATSGIESRFAPDYDPRTDIEPGTTGSIGHKNEGDWDDAVETFRDLQKWKQQGADRLRAAGFSDDYIDKWGKGGQKDESDVRWNQRGGVREWDRGKVMDDDGQVSHKPGWSS